MTDMDTGQLRGSVGTPDNPLLTYEEAVRQRGTDRDLVLWVGQDIMPAGEDEFPKKRSETDLKRIRKQVDEEQLPRLPPDVLPGGWDALGRPWALIDCPAEKVPQIPSVHGTSRVIVAALVSFPPEPFSFVSLVHLDGVILVKNKVGHSTYSGLQGGVGPESHTQGRPPHIQSSETTRIWRQRPRPGMFERTPVECISGRTLGKPNQPAGSRG